MCLHLAVEEETKRMRTSLGHSATWSTSVDTDGDGTSNSGSDGGMPVGMRKTGGGGGSFPAVSPGEGKFWWNTVDAVKQISSDDEEMEPGCSNDEMKESTSEEIDHHKSLGSSAAVQSKLCPRGHWRPAEDEKLRELVSLHGPQNWNLIAEKLHGRSGE